MPITSKFYGGLDLTWNINKSEQTLKRRECVRKVLNIFYEVTNNCMYISLFRNRKIGTILRQQRGFILYAAAKVKF